MDLEVVFTLFIMTLIGKDNSINKEEALYVMAELAQVNMRDLLQALTPNDSRKKAIQHVQREAQAFYNHLVNSGARPSWLPDNSEDISL